MSNGKDIYLAYIYIVSLRFTIPPPLFLLYPFLSSPPFFKSISNPALKINPLQEKFSCNIPLSSCQVNFFQQNFRLLIQLKSKRKIADFRYFNTELS